VRGDKRVKAQKWRPRRSDEVNRMIVEGSAGQQLVPKE